MRPHGSSTRNQLPPGGWWMVVVLAGLTAAVAGCGAGDGLSRAAVHGAVLFDAAPLKAGVIRFIPTGGTKGPVVTAAVRDGGYELSQAEGPVVGTHRVEIETVDHYGFPLDDERAYVQYVERRRAPPPRSPIPDRYHRRSELTAEVTPDGDNQFDFTLHSAGPRAGRR